MSTERWRAWLRKLRTPSLVRAYWFVHEAFRTAFPQRPLSLTGWNGELLLRQGELSLRFGLGVPVRLDGQVFPSLDAAVRAGLERGAALPEAPALAPAGGSLQVLGHWGGGSFPELARHLLAPLHDPQGVLLDLCVDATFRWPANGFVYRRPWVGIIHQAPLGRERSSLRTHFNCELLEHPGFNRSLSQCRGLFCFSELQRSLLQLPRGIPVEVIPRPVETPARTFRWEALLANPCPRLVEIGPASTLAGIRSDWLRPAFLHPGLPWTPPVRGVEVLPPDTAREELLASNVVFVQLRDSADVTALWECRARATPVLVNPLRVAVEVLGPDYPLYASSVSESERLLQDRPRLQEGHRYLQNLPAPADCLETVRRSHTYTRLMTRVPNFLIFAHARSGSTTLSEALQVHALLTIAHEPYMPGNRSDFGGPPAHLPLEDEDWHSFREGLLRGYTGIKHLYNELSPEKNHDLLARYPKVIFLYRRNRLQTAVSEAISHQTGEWGRNRARVRSHRLEPISLDWLEKRLATLRGMREVFGRPDGPGWLNLPYETLYSPGTRPWQRLPAFERILEFLGAPPLLASERERVLWWLDENQSRLNSSDSYRRVPNAEELERRFGSPENGFLFA